MRDLLECVCPAALDTAQQPFRSKTWIAALSVIVDRDGGELARTRRLGLARFERAVRAVIVNRGGQKPTLRIVRNLFTALTDPAGVIAHRPGALERIRLILEDWQHAHTRLADTEARMVAALDELQLTGLACSIKGLSPLGAAAILAETGNLHRFRHRPRAGQTRRAGTPAEVLRHLHRPHQTHRARQTVTAAGRLARGLGRPCTPTRSTPPATGT
jgi:transposase